METSDEDKAALKELIQSLYRFANVPVWDGEVNESVAEIFGIMIRESQTCSAAVGWVPKPPGGRATISWLVQQLGRGVFNSHQKKFSKSCVKVVVLKWT